jgi:hypothetical protein
VSGEEQLARRMEEVLTNDALRATLGEAAKRTAVEKWDFGAQAGRCIEFYEKLLSLGRR